MRRSHYFVINKKRVYYELSLGVFLDIDALFLCKRLKKYYIFACCDLLKLHYIIVEVSEAEVYDLLHGNVSIRDVFLSQDKYWDVKGSDSIYIGKDKEKSMSLLDEDLLPKTFLLFHFT